MTRKDKVLDFILDNASTLSAPKIEALVKLVAILPQEGEDPNEFKEENVLNPIEQERPVNMSDITHIQFDDSKPLPLNEY